MEKEDLEPAFPFGFGLSYTEYNYKKMQLESIEDKIVAKVDVSNIGTIAGEEIVQLYVGFENSSVDRPIKLLRGFKRVALKPNETKTVSIVVKKKDLAWYNPENNVWEVENITYTIYIGASSSNKDLLAKKISF